MRRPFRLLFPSSVVPGPATGWHASPLASRFLLVATFATMVSGCADHAAARPALHRVVIRGFKFEPANFSISAGDTVEWLNQDLVPHTATAGNRRWDSHSILPDSSWRAVLTTRGPEPYGCQLHPVMRARLEVR